MGTWSKGLAPAAFRPLLIPRAKSGSATIFTSSTTDAVTKMLCLPRL
eukprot:CAMPEP_0119107016 /NCGR_PEP_ID=MMETSP1180-20130426/7901_1 /TAXON_ID=3052 ORGANISM="Chlamydomonas cf sp, Strain CCMP681" /NCGR_SAMPLE_ID=MMETSP1180 /ASSEMBLY_ACC=CAM_ASM_000741 /LENGTH=46 /DNA_ID= /DNA_START= /DNA_END= /DNA_ORIENTATION=